MSLTVSYSAVLDKTVAYLRQGQNVFEAKGVWTETEVRMALRLLKSLPPGSWSRALGTVQFAVILMLARALAGVEASLEEFRDKDIFRSLADGSIVIGKRVDVQPEFVGGVEILFLDPATADAATYELVYDHVAQTLAWQKATTTSTNTIPVAEGVFDVLDETGVLFARVRIRPAELPPESRTESFTVKSISTRDFLSQVADNYTDGRLPRLTGESDSLYRARTLARLVTIRTTIWGMRDRLRQLLGYVPRIEETRERFEDWCLAGVGAPGEGTYMSGTSDTFYAGASSANYFLNVRVKAADAGRQDVADAVAESAPASRRVDITSGYGVPIASLRMADAVLPTTGGAAFQDAGGNFIQKQIKFQSMVDETAYWTFIVPDDYAGEDTVMVLHFRGGSTGGGYALLSVSQDALSQGAAWDRALTLVREVKVRTPNTFVSGLGGPSGEDFLVLNASWTAGQIVHLALTRLGTDPRDTWDSFFYLIGVKILKRT